VRLDPARAGLHEHGVDAPQVLDVVDDVAGENEAVQPADDASVRHAQHPREVVHAQREEARPLPQRLREEEQQRFVPADALDDDEECGEVGAHGGHPLRRLWAWREEADARRVLEGVVRSREPTAARIRREQIHGWVGKERWRTGWSERRCVRRCGAWWRRTPAAGTYRWPRLVPACS